MKTVRSIVLPLTQHPTYLPVQQRYIAAILWVSDGEVHDGETWQLQCAYLQEEENQELNRQQQPWADRLWPAVDHLCVGDASTPCRQRPLQASGLWPSSILLDAPHRTSHAVRPTPYATRPTTYTVRPMRYAPCGTPHAVCPTPYAPRRTPMVKREKVWLNFLSVFQTTPLDR
jgi:hypothetical protein